MCDRSKRRTWKGKVEGSASGSDHGLEWVMKQEALETVGRSLAASPVAKQR